MKSRGCRAAGAALLACAWAAVADEPPRFAVETRVVHLDVHVSRDGRPVDGLRAADFDVRDDGRPREVALVGRGNASIQAVLLLDTSGSVAGARLERLRSAARAFLDGLDGADQVALATFSSDARLVAPAGSSRAELRRALDGLAGGGGTALFDAVGAALRLGDPRRGRPVLVVFSDGENLLSWLTPDKVLAVARDSETSVYVVQSERGARAWNDPTLPAGRRQVGDAPEFLSDLAAETGGRVWRTSEAGLEQAFLDALAEVKSRYLLRFEVDDGARAGWHRLEVRLRRGKGAVRARRGYWVRDEAAP